MGKSRLDTAVIFQKIAYFCTLCTPTVVDWTTIDEALHYDFTDFEDAMQYFSAFHFGVDTIITRNKRDFEKSQIPIYELVEYLQKNM